MRYLSVLIVDDDQTAASLLKNFVKVQGVTTKIDAVNSTKEGMVLLEQNEPDIIFLDINMPEEDGLQFAQKIKDLGVDSNIVFTTAFSKYAIPAFELKPLDYLLKPFGIAEVESVIQKVLDLQAPQHKDKNTVSLSFRNNQRLIFKKPSDIFYFEAKKGRVSLYDINGNVESLSMTLDAIIESILNYNFIRVNRSNVINLDYLVNIDSLSNGTLECKSLKKIFHFSKESLAHLEKIGMLKIK